MIPVSRATQIPFIAGTLFGTNHNIHRGGSIEDKHADAGQEADIASNPFQNDDSKKIIDELVNILAAGDEDSEASSEARCWKRLGKILLDAGEYAESRRIFRRGAIRCPRDEGLNHHLKVFNAFYNENDAIIMDDQSSSKNENDNHNDSDRNSILQPPLERNDAKDKDIFLSLDFPHNAIPDQIIQMAKKHSENVPLEGLSHLLHASKEPILSKQACEYLINAAETAVTKKGWTKDRHVQAPTCDIPTFELEPQAVLWLKDAMNRVLFPLLSAAFPKGIGLNSELLQIQDMFVVRYDGGEDEEDGVKPEAPGFNQLKPHEDESIISLTIALNDMKDYDGGGLFIASTGDLLNGDAGTVLGFAGGLLHGGYPVQKGTRFILTVFLYVDENSSGLENGYVLKAIDERVCARD